MGPQGAVHSGGINGRPVTHVGIPPAAKIERPNLARTRGSRKLLAAIALVAFIALPEASAKPGTRSAAAPFSAASLASPPLTLGLDPFYRKYVDAAGIPIVGSAKAPDAALRIARDIVKAMLAHRQDIRRELVRQGTRVAVMAAEEGTMDLPEHAHWKKPARNDPRLTACERDRYDELILPLTDSAYWNHRTRGTGGTLTTIGAENLLAAPGSRYFGENILVHEFSHPILAAIQRVDPALYGRVQKAYDRALAAGKWKGDYASVTVDEYWAEGTQFWFNSNMISRLDDGTVLSPSDLKAYDPLLHAVLEEAYGRRHRIAADPFYKHLARLNVPLGRKSADC